MPAEAIEGFEITISTGSDATDADIYFCIARHSDASRDCTRLDTLGVDDWDSGSIETYMVTSAGALRQRKLNPDPPQRRKTI